MDIYTVGHSNHPIHVFIDILKSAKINMVVDVRSKPTSRWPQYSSEALAESLRAHKIDYRWLGRVLGGQNPIPTTHPYFVEKMQAVMRFANTARVAMMCSEGKPCDCHRAGKLTAWLHRSAPDVRTIHIMPDGVRLDAREYEPKVRPIVWCEELAR